MNKFLNKRVLIGFASGAVVGVGLLYFSILAFVDSSNTSPGEWLFPYAVVADPYLLSWTVLVLSLLQFPLYGIILGVAVARQRRTLIASIVLILCIHLVAAVSARVSRANYLERIKVVPSMARNRTSRWTGAAGACFASNLVRRRLRETAPPGQL